MLSTFRITHAHVDDSCTTEISAGWWRDKPTISTDDHRTPGRSPDMLVRWQSPKWHRIRMSVLVEQRDTSA
jgi:hypothetical protein